MNAILISGLILGGNLSRAAEPATRRPALKLQTLARVTSSSEAGVSQLAAMVDDRGALKGIRFDNRTENGSSVKTFDLEQITSRSGVVLVERDGFKAIILNGSVDSQRGVGVINIRYLTSAFSSSYASCVAQVRRTTNGQWQIIGPNRAAVSNVRVEQHMTGISALVGLCQ